MVTHVCDCTKSHDIVHFQWENYMVCELYLNEMFKNIKHQWLSMANTRIQN